MRFLQHHTVVRDGWHNMLTSLVYWRNYYWLAYRRVSGHFESDGGIVILRSVDLKRWHEVVFLKTARTDWNPRLCLAETRLLISFGTSYPVLEESFRTTLQGTAIRYNPGTAKTEHLGVVHSSFTDDGVHWSTPTPIWKNQAIFSVRFHKGFFYATAWGRHGDPRNHLHGPLDLLISDNGLNWKKLSTIAGVGSGFDESDFCFRPNGEIWVIASAYKGTYPNTHQDNAGFFYAKPPYQDWKYADLNIRVAAPCFCECGGKLYVAARRFWEDPWTPQSVPAGNIAIFTVEKGKITPFFALPAQGDTWQPSLFSGEPSKLIISYNSQHAYLSGVLEGKIPIPASAARPDVYVGDNDIYLAEILVN